MLKNIIFLILISFGISSCLHFSPTDLKSPCVAIESEDGSPNPCVKRSVNDHWLT